MGWPQGVPGLRCRQKESESHWRTTSEAKQIHGPHCAGGGEWCAILSTHGCFLKPASAHFWRGGATRIGRTEVIIVLEMASQYSMPQVGRRYAPDPVVRRRWSATLQTCTDLLPFPPYSWVGYRPLDARKCALTAGGFNGVRARSE